MHDLEIGRAGEEIVRARSLGIEFALGPLVRGEWRASELHLIGPQISLGLDASGHLQAPNFAVGFNADRLKIDQLSIEDGQVTLTDAASGASMMLERLWFNGEARSLLGPFKGDGAATLSGELYPFRISTGRYSEDDGLKIHFNVDPISHPLSIEADGLLAFDGGEPRFEGTLNLGRPVGIAARDVVSVTQPWRLSGKIKVTAAVALMQQLEFQFGPEEQGLKLTGVVDFKFGAHPRFDGVLSGRQIDLDPALAAGDGSRTSPAAVIARLTELGDDAFRPAIPIQVGVGIDQITLGGNSVQNFRGDIRAGPQGWNLDGFEFRAPGFTQARLSGLLAVGAGGVVFAGPIEVTSGDPVKFAAWLEGREEPVQTDPHTLRMRGDVTFSRKKLSVELLKAELDRKPVAGRLTYVFAAGPGSAKLDAALSAPELDLDAALGFSNALLAGSNIVRPHDMAIAADIGRATIAGIMARNASVLLKVGSGGLQVDRLSVADLAGAAFSASGRIGTAALSPRGDMRVDLDAQTMMPVMALLERFAPDMAQALGRSAPAIGPAKLHARLTIDSSGPATDAKLVIDGSLGKVRIALSGQGSVDPIALTIGDIKLDGKLEADDGTALIAMLGLNRAVGVGASAGVLMVNASGPARGELRFDGRLIAAGLEAGVSGTARLWTENPSAVIRAKIVRADLSPLRGAGGGRAALPVTFAAGMAWTGNNLSLSDLNANIGGATLRGKLAVTLQPPYRVQGDIEADNADGTALIAAAIGMPAQAGNNVPPQANTGAASWAWSSEPFGDGAFGEFTGQVAIKVQRFDMSPRLAAREFRASLRLGRQEFAIDDMTGDVVGGRLTGRISFSAADGAIKTLAKLSIVGADAAALLPAAVRPPVTGTLGFSAEVEGKGLSPIALISSLKGTGRITLADGQFAGLDSRAFDTVIRAVDQGLPIDAARIATVVGKALDSGQLAVKRAESTIAVSAGQIRLSNIAAESKDASLTLSGNLDLTNDTIDARLVLSGSNEVAGARPDIFIALKGPAAAPLRSIDVAGLTGWLTLRAVEFQAKRLRAIEGVSPGVTPPKNEVAPALAAPTNVRPLPVPRRNNPPPASFGPQN